MTTQRTVSNRELSAAADILADLPRRRNHTRALVDDLLRHLDNSSELLERVSGNSGELTPTEAAAEARLHLTRHLDDIEAHCRLIVTAINDVTRNCDTILRRRDEHNPEPKPRCDSGIGRDGYNIARADGGWSDPNCDNIPDKHRRTCNACRMRETRWRQAHGLARRDEPHVPAA